MANSSAPPPYFAAPPDLWIPIPNTSHRLPLTWGHVRVMLSRFYAFFGRTQRSPLQNWNVIEPVQHIEQVKSQRDVWRFSRPLEASWNHINPLRYRINFQHWGVFVADIAKEKVEKILQKPKRWKYWFLGGIHELSRIGKAAAYRFYKWMAEDIKKGTGLKLVGTTEMTDREISTEGKGSYI